MLVPGELAGKEGGDGSAPPQKIEEMRYHKKSKGDFIR